MDEQIIEQELEGYMVFWDESSCFTREHFREIVRQDATAVPGRPVVDLTDEELDAFRDAAAVLHAYADVIDRIEAGESE